MKPEPSPARRALEAAQAALAAEHAAAYAYGVIGARASAARAAEAREAYGGHLARRDALVRSVREMGGAPRPAEPAYALPYDCLLYIEDRVAGAYSDLVRAADGRLRREAADALSAAAVRAARWRGVGVAFPGLTERAEPARTS